ncbi:MAG TPA: acylphosphatase [Burkholderiales bacterium]|nr:acylphosphatase [Burkholderiales bacterium]
MKVTSHAIVRGRVQGVGFREYLRREAERLGVTGWVRNRRDGTVEAMVHGAPDDVAQLLNWMRRGPPAACVTDVQVNEATGEFEVFEHLPTT